MAMRERAWRQLTRIGLLAVTFLAIAAPVLAAESGAARVDSGDTAWLLVSTALVMMMTAPGLALFYGGLVSQRNVLSTLMHSFIMLALIGVQWVLWGYSLSFGTDIGSLIGGLDFLGFSGVGPAPNGQSTIPHLAFAMYQGMFAIITPALISGAIAERMNFKAYLLFTLLWATLIYDPLAHWVWGGGWLQKLGALDFAGGLVVHVSSGVSALVAALLLGRRTGYPERVAHPHNIPLVLIGGGLLWFGWFGFNGGSALAANGLAALALATTNTSAAAAALTWTLLEWSHRGKPGLVGAVSGAVAGLVGITPAAGYVTIPAALAIGVSTAAVCYLGVAWLKPRLGYDDSLDVFGVHGLGGIWGAIATGIFASKAVNEAGADGLLHGNAGLLVAQLASVVAAAALAAAGTYAILKIVGAVTPLRASRGDEATGMDLALHGETAYSFAEAQAGGTAQANAAD